MTPNPRETDPRPSLPSPQASASLPSPCVTDEFYIGYDAPPMPPGIARIVKRAVLMIGAAVPVAAGVLAIGHTRIDGGTFDFGRPRQVSGVIGTRPYPAIRVDGANRDAGEGESQRDVWALLVAPGKHGADALVAGFDGARVTLEGTRIQRGDRLMFEVTPGSIARDERSAASSASSTSSAANAAGAAAAMRAARASNGAQGGERVEDAHVADAHGADGAMVTLRGEIVDSKCHLGVMVPGEGKTHKDCASLCLRGGIPPALLVRDREGRSALLLLVTPSGDPVGQEAVVRLAGEPVEVTGVIASGTNAETITRRGKAAAGWPVLRTDPSTWRPLAAAR